MSSFEDMFRGIERQVAATPGKSVLIVEGPSDTDFLTFMLDKLPYRLRNLHTQWVFGVAGGKSGVLRMLEKRPDWLGLIDRDAQSDDELRALQRQTPNLHLLPRYCIENYLVDPCIYDVLSKEPKYQKKARAIQAAKQQIIQQIPHAVRHASLWRAVQPLQDQLTELGFNGVLLKYRLPDDQRVRETLESWSRLLDADTIYQAYQGFQRQAESISQEQALSTWIHGKLFWRNTVSPVLLDALGEEEQSRLERLLLRLMPLPADIDTLIRRIVD